MPNPPTAPGEVIPDDEAENLAERGEGAEVVLVVRDDAVDAVHEALEVSDGQIAPFAAFELYQGGLLSLVKDLAALDLAALSAIAEEAGTKAQKLSGLARVIMSGAFARNPDLLPEDVLMGARAHVLGLSKEERQMRVLEQALVVHDVNNKMTALIGTLELLSIGVSSPRGMASIANALNGIQGLISVHEGQTLKDVFGLLEPGSALQVGISFEVDGALDLRPTLSAPRLGRVLYNLMRNAANAGAKKVILSAQNLEGKMVLTVKDDGPGFRGVEPIKTREEADRTGHGNALQISRQFCELSGGSLTHGDLNQAGAEWVIELPLKN